MCGSSNSRRLAAALAALLLCVGAQSGSADEPLPLLHKLAGVVVSKKDGKPLAGVEVAMTHAELGNLVFVGGGQLRTFGQDEAVLLFFPKRNGKVKVQGKTDAAGRFVLEGFTSPASKYNVGASHPQYGSALLTNVVPADYGERELRIEIDEPSFVRTEIPGFDAAVTDSGWQYVNLALAPEAPSGASEQPAATSAPAVGDGSPAEPAAPQVMFDLKREPGGSESEVGMARWGPLPGGRKYTVSRVSYSREAFSTSTLFARSVMVPPGQTLKVDLKSDGDIAMTGRVTGVDDQPLPGVNLKLHVGDDVVIGAVSGKDGAYELRDVPAGKHLLELLRRAAPGFG